MGPLNTGNPPPFFLLLQSLSQLIRDKTKGKGWDERAEGVPKDDD